MSKQRYLPRLRTSTLLLLALLPPRAHLLLSQLQRLNACLRLLLPGCHAGCIVVLAAVAPLSADALLLLLERLHLVPLTQHPPAHPHTHDIRTNTHLISTSSTHHTLSV